MSSTTKLTFADFLQLPEHEDRYELNEGELLVTPSPTPYHDLVQYRLRNALTAFVSVHHLGMLLGGMDFRLTPNTVRARTSPSSLRTVWMVLICSANQSSELQPSR